MLARQAALGEEVHNCNACAKGVRKLQNTGGATDLSGLVI